jgi:hypothetical protein
VETVGWFSPPCNSLPDRAKLDVGSSYWRVRVLRCMLIGIVIGVAAEIVARAFNLWIYRQPQTPILNVIAMFGLVMGGVAALAPKIGVKSAFVIAFAIGLAYEFANLRLLDWWYFPGERLGFIHGNAAIAVVIALLWGAVPIVITLAQSRLPHPRRLMAPTQTRLEALAVRERQLIGKLEALRQRERDVEARLDQTRAMKEALLARQAVRQLGTRDATPTP